MTQDDAEAMILRGAEAWNAWRAKSGAHLSFSRPHWYDSPGPNGIQVKGNNRVDFSGMDLSGIEVYSAFAEGLNMRNAMVVDAHFEEGDFSRADFSGTTFRNTRFNKTIFTGACFDGASFINCNLNRVNLVGASFCLEEITETVVYGVAAWDIRTCEGMKQSRLVIERTYDLYSELIESGTIPLMVDDIELAQFVYYLSNHKKMRDTINVLNDRGVLLLGRFRDGGLERLYRVREWLQDRGYMAMIFDFERPHNLSLTETVVTMAGLSKFVFADLSGGSVPWELQAIATKFKKPIVVFGDPFSLLPDLADHTALIKLESDDARLLTELEKSLPEVERLYANRIEQLAKRDARADAERASATRAARPDGT